MSMTAKHEAGTFVVTHEFPAARKVFALVRIALGWIFLWAFLDKTFALGYATGRLEDGTIDRTAAWINGGSPTYGFLTFATKGPFAEFFQGLAGQTWVDWLFMLGLLGIGVSLILGVFMRIGAVGGAVLLFLMYLAVLPPQHNPIVDDHIVYGLVLIGLMMARIEDTWGLGSWWGRLPFVERYAILK